MELQQNIQNSPHQRGSMGSRHCTPLIMTSRLIEPRAISQNPSNCGPFHLNVNREQIFLQDTMHQQLFVLTVRIGMITFQLKTLRWTFIRSCSSITYLEFSAGRYRELHFEQVLRGSKLRSVAWFSSLMLCFFFQVCFQVCWFLTAYTGLKCDKLWNSYPFDLWQAESLNYFSLQQNSFYSLR